MKKPQMPMARFGLILLIALSAARAAPGDQPSYRQIPLDCGGWFSGFAVHPGGRLYGYGDVFGAFRSDDSGKTWHYLNGSLTTDDNFVTGMAVAKGNADIVAFRSASRLYTSKDGGANWTVALSDLEEDDLVRGASPVMYHPANDSDLWMAGKRKDLAGTLWHSANGAGQWSKVGGTTFDKAFVTSIYAHPDYPDQVWVGTKGAFYVSTDGTSASPTFTKVSTTDIPLITGIVRRGKDGTAYAGMGYFASSIGGFQVTANDWTKSESYGVKRTLIYPGGGPTNATVLANGNFLSGTIGDGDQSVSSDGGLTWTAKMSTKLAPQPQPVWSPPIPPTQETDYGRDFIVQDPKDPNRLYITGGLAPAISTDLGKTWHYVPNNSGLAAVMTQKVSFPRKNPNMVLIPGADLGVFVVTDGGTTGNAQEASFRTVHKLVSAHEVLSSDDGTTLVAAGTDQSANTSLIMRSTDSGKTWRELDLAKSGLPYCSEGITRAAITPGNPIDFLVMLGTNNQFGTPRVYRTIDGGVKFTPVGVGVLPNNMDTGVRYDPKRGFLLVDGVNPGTRYLAARSDNFFVSTDNGQTWAAGTHPFGGKAWIQDLAVDRGIAGKLWALVLGQASGRPTTAARAGRSSTASMMRSMWTRPAGVLPSGASATGIPTISCTTPPTMARPGVRRPGHGHLTLSPGMLPWIPESKARCG